MGSLLFNAALLGGGFALGRAPLLPLATQIMAELSTLATPRKVPFSTFSGSCCSLSDALVGQVAMLALVLLLLALYVLGVLLPLRWVAEKEAQETAKRKEQPEPTSFRRELRRRGSYSVSYVTDIKAHVFARC